MEERSRQDDRLQEGSLGLLQVLFQSIAYISPATAVILALGLGFSVAGARLCRCPSS